MEVLGFKEALGLTRQIQVGAVWAQGAAKGSGVCMRACMCVQMHALWDIRLGK